eukprot:3034913-Prymnesium_polylepis.1
MIAAVLRASRRCRAGSSTQRLGTEKREEKRGGRARSRHAVHGSGAIDRRRICWAVMGRLARHGHAMLGWCMFGDAREPRQSVKVLWFWVLPWSMVGRACATRSWHSWERVRTQGGRIRTQRRSSRTVICA